MHHDWYNGYSADYCSSGGLHLSDRALPFMIFKNAEALPRKIVYLGNVLPMAIMLCLIVYCVRNTAFFQYPYGLPELLGIGSVVLLHVWKRNNMISILGGTLLYMMLVQLVFV